MLLLLSHSVVSDSLRPRGLQPTRLLRPWDFPGKSTGVVCHCLLRYAYTCPLFFGFPSYLGHHRAISSVLYSDSHSFVLCSVSPSCLTLCGTMDHSLPGSSVHLIFQTRILGWLTISYSRGSSQPRAGTRVSCVSCIGRWVLYH